MNQAEIYRKLNTYFKTKYQAFDYRRGWLKSDCPFCGGVYKFGINFQSHTCHCFKCGYLNNPVRTALELEKISHTRELEAILAHTPETYFKAYEPKEVKPPSLVLPESFLSISRIPGTDRDIYFRYLHKKRGISTKVIRKSKAGFIREDDHPFHGYLIFPVFAMDNPRKVIYYQGRRVLANGPKFKNPDQDELGVNKSHIIYNGHILRTRSKVYIVESIINVLTLEFKAVAGLGKSFNLYTLDLLKSSKVTEFVIILDPDAIELAIKLALELVFTKKVKLINLPEGKDVNDVGKEEIYRLEKESEYHTYNSLILLKNGY